MKELSEKDKEMLTFANGFNHRAGSNLAAIRQRFDCSPVRYFQRLNALIDDPAALAWAPVLVNRLRRVRVAAAARAR
jgi:hypothetical protein